MGRIKKGHSGWHSHGLYLKYKQPAVEEKPFKPGNKKKDTNRWCRGKVGEEHEWHRYQSKRYNWQNDDYIWDWTVSKCIVCKKTTYKRRSHDSPFHASIYYESEPVQIQVRVNGKIIPFDENYTGRWWCSQCHEFHNGYR